jgi:DNA repair protein RadA
MNLEDLPGVGASTADKLREAGYKELSSVAAASSSELKDAVGLGEAVANRIILGAKESLDIRFRTGSEMLDKRKSVRRITTGSSALDNLLGGGIESQAISEFYGAFGSGKTQIVHQAAVNVQLPQEEGGLELGAIFIDSENTFRPERIIQMSEGKGLEPEKILDNIQVARAYNSSDQILWAEKAAEMAQSGDVGLIIVDSLTSQFRADYTGSSTFRLYLRKSKGGKRVARLVDSPNLPDGEAIFMVTPPGITD